MAALEQNGVQISGQPEMYSVHEFQLGSAQTV
jgi:hypothetical protein